MGPSWGGYVYQGIGFAAPFLTGAIFMLGGTILSFKLMHDKYSKPYIESLKTYKPEAETVLKD